MADDEALIFQRSTAPTDDECKFEMDEASVAGLLTGTNAMHGWWLDSVDSNIQKHQKSIHEK